MTVVKKYLLSNFLASVTERGRTLLGLTHEGEGISGLENLIERSEALLAGRGEATGLAMAEDILDRYSNLDDVEQFAFFRALATQFGPEPNRLNRALKNWPKDFSEVQASELHFASEPRRQELFRRLNRPPNGTGALVKLRADLLRILNEHPELQSVDRDLHHLFSSWFNRGFLELHRIDWSAPAVILDKIIRYEAVHEIRDWNDLRGRIDPSDRRCYAFFHPALENEPLIFVEVALTQETPAGIEPILSGTRNPSSEPPATTAVFYSISNCQSGLQGVSFGNFLIKQVVDELAKELPEITTFVTLSPVPGFMTWLRQMADQSQAAGLETACLTAIKHLETPAWHRDKTLSVEIEAALMPMAAYYLLIAKTAHGEPVDPVARFHLGNGARLERLNWLGDRSQKGLAQSAGLMANYRYVLKDVERNHEAYVNFGEIVATATVTTLLKAKPLGDVRVNA